MYSKKYIKINPYEVEPQVLKCRNNYKLVDPSISDNKHLTFGMVVVEPGGVCEPAHTHEDTGQEEIMFGLTNRGIIILGDDKEEVEIGPKDAIFVPPKTFHGVKNPYNVPFEMLWILSPAGWVFDKHPGWEEKAKKGEAL